jgi:hypothetical protein
MFPTQMDSQACRALAGDLAEEPNVETAVNAPERALNVPSGECRGLNAARSSEEEDDGA